MNRVLEWPEKQTVKPRLTMQVLHRELQALRERVQELEDLRELN